MYSVVGLSIALGIYLFKSREKHQPSAKEIIPLPPQNGFKDDSEDLNNTQTLPQEVNDKVQELEIVHSDSFLGNSERVAELEPMKVNRNGSIWLVLIIISILGKISTSPVI